MTAANDRPAPGGLARALEALAGVYADLACELDAAPVRCAMRGLCCNFEYAGHLLLATDLEVEFARRHGGESPAGAGPDACPFYRSKACRLREGRPLGCRVYFCDPGFADEMHVLAARYHARVVTIHEQYGIPYRYARFVRTIRGLPDPRDESR